MFQLNSLLPYDDHHIIQKTAEAPDLQSVLHEDAEAAVWDGESWMLHALLKVKQNENLDWRFDLAVGICWLFLWQETNFGMQQLFRDCRWLTWQTSIWWMSGRIWCLCNWFCCCNCCNFMNILKMAFMALKLWMPGTGYKTNTKDDSSCEAVDLVALGNPHFSLEEYGRMAELCRGRQKHPEVTVVVTSGPQVRATGMVFHIPFSDIFRVRSGVVLSFLCTGDYINLRFPTFFFWSFVGSRKPWLTDWTSGAGGEPEAGLWPRVGSLWCPTGKWYLLVHAGRGGHGQSC